MPYEDQSTWEEHAHEAIVHEHIHFHVTHNYNDRAGGFDHFSWKHGHAHDHAAVTHAHYPHQDFVQEHDGEAHIHDHGEPVKKRTPARSAAAVTPDSDTATAESEEGRETRSRRRSRRRETAPSE